MATDKLEKALSAIAELEGARRTDAPLSTVDPRALLLVTIIYLAALLSLSLHSVANLILFSLYPVVSASMSPVNFGRVFRKSLYALPFVALIGIFNPIYNHRGALSVGEITISQGWIEFFSITLRGLLSVQSVLIAVYSAGFIRLCRGMQQMRMPAMFAVQLMLVYRYTFVLLREARDMQMAREARSFGRTSYPPKMWGVFIGQLLLRTAERSRRIYRAMLARGFDGRVPMLNAGKWHTSDTLYLAVWTALIAAGRLTDASTLFTFINN